MNAEFSLSLEGHPRSISFAYSSPTEPPLPPPPAPRAPLPIPQSQQPTPPIPQTSTALPQIRLQYHLLPSGPGPSDRHETARSKMKVEGASPSDQHALKRTANPVGSRPAMLRRCMSLPTPSTRRGWFAPRRQVRCLGIT